MNTNKPDGPVVGEQQFMQEIKKLEDTARQFQTEVRIFTHHEHRANTLKRLGYLKNCSESRKSISASTARR